jgi:hypothetical protein
MNPIQEKKCSNPKCLKVKPLTEFYKSGGWCKTCRNKVSSDWKKKNPEKLRAYRNNYYHERVEKTKQGDLAAIVWLEKINERRKVLMEKKKIEREIKKECTFCLQPKLQSEFYLSSHDKAKYRRKCKECERIISRKDNESIKLLLIKDGVDKNAIDNTMIEVKINDLEIKRVLKKLNAPWREGIVYERSAKKPVVPPRYLDSVSRNGDSLWLNISRVLASVRNARISKTTALN